MRPRVNPSAICSSDNYQESKRLHKQYLKDTHDDRMHSISMMSFSIRNPKVTHYSRAYIEVFGKRLYLKGCEIGRAKDAGYAIHYE